MTPGTEIDKSSVIFGLEFHQIVTPVVLGERRTIPEFVFTVAKIRLRSSLTPRKVAAGFTLSGSADVVFRPQQSAGQTEVYKVLRDNLLGASATTSGASAAYSSGSLHLLDFGGYGSQCSLGAGGAVLECLQQVGYLGLDAGKRGTVVGQRVDDRLDGSELGTIVGDGVVDTLEQRQLVGERAVDIAQHRLDGSELGRVVGHIADGSLDGSELGAIVGHAGDGCGEQLHLGVEVGGLVLDGLLDERELVCQGYRLFLHGSLDGGELELEGRGLRGDDVVDEVHLCLHR